MDKNEKKQMEKLCEEELFLIDGGDTNKISWQGICDDIVGAIKNFFN